MRCGQDEDCLRAAPAADKRCSVSPTVTAFLSRGLAARQADTQGHGDTSWSHLSSPSSLVFPSVGSVPLVLVLVMSGRCWSASEIVFLWASLDDERSVSVRPMARLSSVHAPSPRAWLVVLSCSWSMLLHTKVELVGGRAAQVHDQIHA